MLAIPFQFDNRDVGDRSEAVKTIKTPTLILHGADDGLLPPAHGEHTASLIEGSKLVIFEGMGHNMPEEVVPALLKNMIEHMREVDLVPLREAIWRSLFRILLLHY